MGVPTYMYKSVKGEIVSELFDSEDIPKGWHDSPENAQPKKRVKDDNNATDSK